MADGTKNLYNKTYMKFEENFSIVALLNSLPIDIILWIALGVIVLIFGIFSSILFWHWRLYSTGKFTTVANMIVYLSVGAGFIFIMLLSIVWRSLV